MPYVLTSACLCLCECVCVCVCGGGPTLSLWLAGQRQPPTGRRPGTVSSPQKPPIVNLSPGPGSGQLDKCHASLSTSLRVQCLAESTQSASTFGKQQLLYPTINATILSTRTKKQGLPPRAVIMLRTPPAPRFIVVVILLANC